MSGDDNESDALESYKNVTQIVRELHDSEDEDEDYTYYDRVNDMVLSVDERKLYEFS